MLLYRTIYASTLFILAVSLAATVSGTLKGMKFGSYVHKMISKSNSAATQLPAAASTSKRAASATEDSLKYLLDITSTYFSKSLAFPATATPHADCHAIVDFGDISLSKAQRPRRYECKPRDTNLYHSLTARYGTIMDVADTVKLNHGDAGVYTIIGESVDEERLPGLSKPSTVGQPVRWVMYRGNACTVEDAEQVAGAEAGSGWCIEVPVSSID